MKYIRTKDGRIMLIQEEREQEIVALFDNELVCINKRKVLKQADTIEELCDEMVYILESSKNPILASNSTGTIIKLAIATNDVKNIYGAIWTNKGLIYVAKMNEAGELCLL